MRKVTSRIASAFRAGKSSTEGNTHTDGLTVFLHGNAVARKHNGRLEVSWAGWPTSTTAERINGVLREYNSAFSVCRKNRKPHFSANGVLTPMNMNAWQAVTDVTL